MRWAAPLLAAALVWSGCGSGGDGDVRDGTPRYPDDEGVATELTTASITLDGERTYAVSDRLAAFNTYTLELEPMLGREGQYVQIGLDGDTMVWMAGIGAVVDLDPPSAFYVGELEEVIDGDDGRRAVFVDGTVLRLSPEVDVPESDGPLQARIEVARHEVIELRTTLGAGAEG